MTHPNIDALADGELDADQAQAVRIHLDGCERCRLELQRAWSFGALYRGAQPDIIDHAREGLAAAIGIAGLARAVALDLASTAAWWTGVVVEDAGLRLKRWARMEDDR